MRLLYIDDNQIVYYIFGGIIGIILIYFFFRWIFEIDIRVKQNESIINLLKLIAKKKGATDDEIKNATRKEQD